MFRAVAIVTFAAAMLGTGAATLNNARHDGVPPAPAAIERPSSATPAEKPQAPKRDSDFVAFKDSGSR